MRFVHEDPEFGDLLRVVAGGIAVPPAFVEKDYWITHTLWSLQDQGFEPWFKGGTSLSKGFGLVRRLSDDLDLLLGRGSVDGVPEVTNWKSEGSRAVEARRAFFTSLEQTIVVPAASVTLDRALADRSQRSGMIEVRYPGLFLTALGPDIRPYVLLEIGSARVTPTVRRDVSSFVHEHLRAAGMAGEFRDNRALAVRCVHPLLTLLEKLDALSRRFQREDLAPSTFVRHYEDAAHIIDALPALPAVELGPRALSDELVREKLVRAAPTGSDPAFQPDNGPRWAEVHAAWAGLDVLFWGPRLDLEACCARIRAFIGAELSP